MRVLIASILICLSSWTAAGASDLPEFLKGRIFSTDTNSCGDTSEGDGLQLSKEGIYGQEFSCQFLAFEKDADPDTGRIYAVVATANCSDDSGIMRPDLITLSPYIEGGQVIVQSQNEYVMSEVEILIAQELGKAFPEKSSFAWVSNTYNICE